MLLRSRTITVAAALTVLSAAASPLLSAQNSPRTSTAGDDAWLDAGAASLVARARAARDEADRSIRSYDAIVRQRTSARLRMPLKDRTVYRQEATTRIHWQRDAPPVVQLLAGREENPAEVEAPTSLGALSIDDIFDPAGERIYFGSGSDSDSGWIVHPLATDAELRYRYRSGDTMTIAFPDGRRLRVAELQILPRERSPQLLSGAFWIEPETGAVVQAVYRLARQLDVQRDAPDDWGTQSVPAVLTPMELHVEMVVIEYSLWNFRHWLPRLMRAEGMMRAGAFRVPFALEAAYEILDVASDGATAHVDEERAQATADSVLAAWSAAGDFRTGTETQHGREVTVLVPRDERLLLTSPDLPPPIWRGSPDFASTAELAALRGSLDRLPRPPAGHSPLHVSWSAARPGMYRYNRVEGFSAGARLNAAVEPYTARLEARIGTADRVPNASLALAHASTRRTVTASGFHALRSFADDNAAFGFGASLGALFFGRDDAEYYRATGAALTIAPGASRRAAWQLSGEIARHAAVTANTEWSVPALWDDSRTFRDAVAADPGTLYAVRGTVSPWWGTDPGGWQGGVELMVHAATGAYEFGRGRVTVRGAAPLAAGVRAGLEVAAGDAAGEIPAQHLWYLGGARTLRGYAGSSATGSAFGRARLDVARAFPAGGVALFADGGWAGSRNAIHRDDALLSAGVGVTLLDGLLRADLARALRRTPGWRLELYFDALL